VLRSNFYLDSRANSSTDVRIIAAPNLLKMTFYPESEIINASHALTILWLVINAAANQPS